MTEQLEQILDGICPSCEQPSQLKYHGRMKDADENPMELYNCVSCGSTVTLSSYLEKNPLPQPTPSSQ